MTSFVFLPTIQIERGQCCLPQTGDRARLSGRCHRCPRGRDLEPESRGSSPAYHHQHPCHHRHHRHRHHFHDPHDHHNG